MSALDAIRDDIADAYSVGIPKASEVRSFKARLWPVVAGWEYIVDDVQDRDRIYNGEAELTRLIQLAIEEKDDDGEDPEKSIGRLITLLALQRASSEFADIIEELESGDADYGYDVPEVERVNLDRSAA